jgi:hypothetical protein
MKSSHTIWRLLIVAIAALTVSAYAADKTTDKTADKPATAKPATAKPAAAKPFTKENMHEVEATIEAIDAATRKVELKGPNGGMQTIVLGPEVRNFAQLHVGDKVRVGYYEGIAAEIKKKGDAAASTKEPGAAVATYRAAEGAKPAAAAGAAVNATVKIESVDTKANTVTFVRPDGFWRTLKVQSPEGEKFIRTLKKGDEVDVTYVEAVAIEVVAAK